MRDLKTHLWQSLARVQAGEVQEVTSHRRSIDRITAVMQPDSASTHPLQKAIVAGIVSWNGQKPVFPPPVKLRGEGKASVPWCSKLAVDLVFRFCEISALIQWLIVEPQSDPMREVMSRAEALAVWRITWAEAMAGLARRQREDPLSSDDRELARQHLITSWSSFGIV